MQPEHEDRRRSSTHEDRKNQIRREIDALVQELVPDGEIVIHIDVCVATRCGPEMDGVLFRRYSPKGADPFYSLISLGILKKRLAKRLRRPPKPQNGGS
jgi:hypothetical protein